MNGIAIITARGGSKRIPRKNIKEFCGKPIIAYSIQAALESQLFDEVMVSTDDAEIADIASSYGASIPFYRSKEASNDFAGTEMVLKEVVEDYLKNGRHFNWMCCIYPTAPFVTKEKLKQCWEIFHQSSADGLVPIVKFSFPPQRSLIVCNGKLVFKWPKNENKRSQDLEPLYHDAGQFYFARVAAFLEQNTLFMRNTTPYILNEVDVQDIDTLEDWKIAEMKYMAMKR